jgi:hypothetical protein
MNEMAARIGVWETGEYHILWSTFFRNGGG